MQINLEVDTINDAQFLVEALTDYKHKARNFMQSISVHDEHCVPLYKRFEQRIQSSDDLINQLNEQLQ